MKDEVSDLFRELADLSGSERALFLEQHSVPPDVRAEVESLLAFDAGTGLLLESPISNEAEDFLRFNEAERAGRRCGPYRLVRLLGRGGAGAVFLSERVDGQLEQRVAIKLLRCDAERPALRDRFLQERQILASLQHPGIARLLDAGQAEDGTPFLVMDYIDGQPIDVYAAQLALREKLNLFLRVCDAVCYAHRNLIVHRDLKPSNILVDASGEPKLLDFGIAKILDVATDQTRTQERLLTPDYASPEQVRGAAQTTATDVYSLGAVLYHLLTGRSPHAFATRTPVAVDIAICNIEPTLASRVNPGVPADLDFILLKALRKEPEERYSSVEVMADDIRAFLEYRAVRARSGNAWYRTRKFVRRYRAVVAAAMITIVGLSAGLFIANRQRLIAQERFRQLHILSSKVFDLDTAIGKVPGTTQARQDLVSVSLQYLERLGESAHGDLDMDQEIGDGYLRVARIQGVPTEFNLGQFDKADESLQKADRFANLVLQSRQSNGAALILSAAIAHDRMIVANSQRHNDEARVFAAKAVERLERFFRAEAITQPQRASAAGYYANVALFHMNIHQYDAAVRYARKSMEVAVSLPEEQKLRAAGLSLIGNSLRSQGRLQEALEALREARRIAEGPIYANFTERALDLYGILLREARTLGQDGGISLGRTEEAIPFYREAVDLMETMASKDPRDQTARDRLATCSRELAELLEDRDPQQSLVLFDLGVQRLRELKTNIAARRREALSLAESSYPLRRLRRYGEARERIAAAFAVLREIKEYPSEKLRPESEAVVALRAQADHEAAVGDPRRAVEIYDRLFAAMTASKPDPSGDLVDASTFSMIYYRMAQADRRAGEAAKAAEMDQRRRELWRHWDEKLPHNIYVQRQLTARSE